MENISVLERKAYDSSINTLTINNRVTDSNKEVKSDPVMESIISEGGNDFFEYLGWIGLAKEPGLMVLSSMQHYYYDHNDLKGINALVNLKKLNRIKHLDSFLHTLYRILPPDASFVGFFNREESNRHGKMFCPSYRFFHVLKNMLDTSTGKHLTRHGMRNLLEENGFKVIDMTEIKGVIYFWVQNSRRQWE